MGSYNARINGFPPGELGAHRRGYDPPGCAAGQAAGKIRWEVEHEGAGHGLQEGKMQKWGETAAWPTNHVGKIG